MRFGTRELILFISILLAPIMSYFIVFRPQSANIEKAQSEIEHKREVLDKLRIETARNADLEETNQSLEESIAGMESLLPTNKEVDQIVRQVSGLATEVGLAPPSLKSTKPLAAARYREQPLEMTTEGTFRGFYEFMLELEKLPRITRIVDMTLKDSSKEGVELEASFTLSIYFRTDDGSAS